MPVVIPLIGSTKFVFDCLFLLGLERLAYDLFLLRQTYSCYTKEDYVMEVEGSTLCINVSFQKTRLVFRQEQPKSSADQDQVIQKAVANLLQIKPKQNAIIQRAIKPSSI